MRAGKQVLGPQPVGNHIGLKGRAILCGSAVSTPLPPDLLARLCELAATVPETVSRSIAKAIRRADAGSDKEGIARALVSSLHPDNRMLFNSFAQAWLNAPAETTGAEVGAALEAAAYQECQLRSDSSVELVWTGPSAHSAGLRNTEQVLLDLIRSAKRSVYVVTFAAYRVDSLAIALRDAVSRGVQVTFILEDKQESEGKVTWNPLPALAGAGVRMPNVYYWPLERRLRNDRGQHGSLHAKFVVADGRTLFLSSANLTEFALTLNIELGVLLVGGDAPRQAENNLSELIRVGVLQEMIVSP